MAVSSPPILKILSDLDIDLMDVNNDVDYLRALMEATNTLTLTNASDKRIPILQEEIRRVRADRKAADPKFKQKKLKVKKTKVDPQKMMGQKMLPAAKLDPKKLTPSDSASNVLVDILTGVTSIRDLLMNQIKQKRTDSKKKRRATENAKRGKKESGLEIVKKGFGALKSGVEKVVAPVKGLFGQVFDFLGKIIFGRVVFKLLEWFQNPENTKKVEAIGKFLKKTWPVLLSAFLLFGTSFGRMAVKLGVMITKFSIRLVTKIIPALIKAIAKMKLGKLLKKIPGFSGGGLVQGYNEGGVVNGEKGVDKVPAMLTEGEFVMSKGAVEQYGTNTLEGMNAAAGGTNKPTLMGGGGFANITNTMSSSSSDSDGSFSVGKRYIAPEEAKEFLSERGMPSMELMDGTVVPDIGKMGAEKIPAALTSTREMLLDSGAPPENIAKLDELIASPNVQPDAIQNSLNRLVPGSQEQVYGDIGDSISMSAKKTSGYKGGGLVQRFQGGGQVRQMGRGASKKRMEIKKGINKPNVKSIKTPVKKSSVVAYNEQSQSAGGGGYKSKSGGNNEVPNFNAAAKRSIHKVKTLGISV